MMLITMDTPRLFALAALRSFGMRQPCVLPKTHPRRSRSQPRQRGLYGCHLTGVPLGPWGLLHRADTERSDELEVRSVTGIGAGAS